MKDSTALPNSMRGIERTLVEGIEPIAPVAGPLEAMNRLDKNRGAVWEPPVAIDLTMTSMPSARAAR